MLRINRPKVLLVFEESTNPKVVLHTLPAGTAGPHWHMHVGLRRLVHSLSGASIEHHIVLEQLLTLRNEKEDRTGQDMQFQPRGF